MHRQSHLLVLGHPAGLAWVLANQQMAFNDTRLAQARKLHVGDRLLLYASKRALVSLKRAVGLVIGEAHFTASVRDLHEPVIVGMLPYRHVADMSLVRLAPFGTGVALSAHLNDLDLFPDATSWTSRIRRTVVPLSDHDASFLSARLAVVAKRPEDVVRPYQESVVALNTAGPIRDARKQEPTLPASDPRSFLLDLLA